ncbi:MAG TPA: adenylate/guanylate cyclase domain-containing protein [Saprospiraceae bacterium]|nr:adenylate/guanylate cyclase domain-containing protein [Saprospiraceae bacterium]
MAQLVAVMHTDIAGYTAITEDNDTLALSFNEKHRRGVKEFIEKHHGVLQEIVGDGSLSYFTSASDCVQCAIALQLFFRTDPVVPVRIGMHIGEIRGEKDLIYGNPINVSSRIESIAVPGSILLSRNVIDSISSRSNFSFVSLGMYAFKHVDQPIEICAISHEGIVVPEAELVTGKLKILERQDIIVFDEWDDQELVRRLPDAKLICQQAVCSYGFINHNYNKLRKFLRDAGRFQCIFIHPESKAIQIAPERHERQLGAGQNIAYIQGQLHLSFHKMQTLGTGVTFKLTHHLPEPIMTFIDPESEEGILFITLSGFRMDLHARPSFVLRKSTHRKWFMFYFQSFRNLWESETSLELNFNQSWEENLQRMEEQVR